MATSGTYNFTLNRDQIITGALRLVGQAQTGQPVSVEQIQDTAEALNIMVKALQAEGIGLWALCDLTVFLDTVSQSYQLGPTSSNFVTTDAIIQNAVAISAALGSTSLTLNSAAGLVSGANIGIQLDSQVTQWTTINGAPAGNVVTLAAALLGSASQNANVFSYVNIAQRPLDILEGRRCDVWGNDTELFESNRSDYTMLATKSNTGTVSQYYYSPTLNNGTLYVWPVSALCTDRAVLTARLPFQDFDNMPDNADFPVEFLRMLKFGLAEEIAPEFDVNPNKYKMIQDKAAATKNAAAFHDTEVSFSFAPDKSGR